MRARNQSYLAADITNVKSLSLFHSNRTLRTWSLINGQRLGHWPIENPKFPNSINYQLTNEATVLMMNRAALHTRQMKLIHCTQLLQGTEGGKLETKWVSSAFQLGFVMTSYTLTKVTTVFLFLLHHWRCLKPAPQLLSRVWHTGNAILARNTKE